MESDIIYWEKLSLEEKNNLVGDTLGLEPYMSIFASADGGVSGCAFVDSTRGPWFKESQLVEWLAEEQKRGFKEGYEIVRKPHHKNYNNDTALAFAIVEVMRWQGFKYQLRDHVGEFKDGVGSHVAFFVKDRVLERADSFSLPEAICVAALRAKGREVKT